MKYRLFGLLAAVLLVVGGTGAFVMLRDGGGASEGPGKALKVALAPEQPLVGEDVTMSGKVAPAGRQVLLERRTGDAWEPIQNGTTGADSAYSFAVSTGEKPLSYRVSAPAGEVAGVDRKARVSPVLEVRTVAARGEVLLRPPVGQAGTGKQALTPGEAIFVPAREGAAVEVQRNDGGGWEKVEAGEQDEDGRFGFMVEAAAEDSPQYRATTVLENRDEKIVTPVVRTSPWAFTWGDEFDGDTLGDPWIMLKTGAYAGRACATVTPDTAQVKDGTARFVAKEKPGASPFRTKACPDGQFLNAQFGTNSAHSYTYGVFAARIRAQEAEGMHSAFWLFPAGVPTPADVPKEDIAGYKGVEIDIMEYFGDEFSSGKKEGKTWSYVYRPAEEGEETEGGAKHLKDGGPQIADGVFDSGKLPSDGYHIYSVEWTPKHYIFRVDGIETSRIEKGISRRPQHLRLSMLTSDWETPELEADSLPASMDVDWVRVWQR